MLTGLMLVKNKLVICYGSLFMWTDFSPRNPNGKKSVIEAQVLNA